MRGIDTAPVSRWRLLADLLKMSQDLNIDAIAEGVETAGEAAACEDLGFRLAQGFKFGKPLPASAYRREAVKGVGSKPEPHRRKN